MGVRHGHSVPISTAVIEDRPVRAWVSMYQPKVNSVRVDSSNRNRGCLALYRQELGPDCEPMSTQHDGHNRRESLNFGSVTVGSNKTLTNTLTVG